MGEIDFPDLIARSKKVEENVLIDAMLGEIEVEPMYRRFGAVLTRDVAPGTTGGQDIQNPVEHRPMVGSGSPDMRFLGREMRLNDRPEFVIDFPECHTSRVLFKASYNCGMTSEFIPRSIESSDGSLVRLSFHQLLTNQIDEMASRKTSPLDSSDSALLS